MQPIKLLLIIGFIVADACSIICAPAVAVFVGESLSRNLRVGRVGDFLFSAIGLVGISVLILWGLDSWFNLATPLEGNIYLRLLVVTIAHSINLVAFVMAIAALTNYPPPDPRGNLDANPHPFTVSVAVILFLILKLIGYFQD